MSVWMHERDHRGCAVHTASGAFQRAEIKRLIKKWIDENAG